MFLHLQSERRLELEPSSLIESYTDNLKSANFGNSFTMLCEHCNGPGNGSEQAKSKCCWTRAMELRKFQRKIKNKYLIEVAFDLIVSVTSVVTDIISLFMYFYKRKWGFAILTLVPILLPTFVFTNVYLVDESKAKRSQAASRIISSSGTVRSKKPEEVAPSESPDEVSVDIDFCSDCSTIGSEETETDSRLNVEEDGDRCQNLLFHCPSLAFELRNCASCWKGCAQCMCNSNHKLRRAGAIAIRKSMQRMFKYGFGTIVLRFIAWAWYIKALIFGWKAYKEPKRFMKIETPNNHWSYELLTRLDFLQAALENAPQCVVQLYALITQPDENRALGILTLIFSFVDFIRVSVYVHWDMDRGPVIAPGGCYDTLLWKCINTSSWILIYSARAAAIALITATAGLSEGLIILIPAGILTFHCALFWKLLSKAEYGVAAQKVTIAVFISVFFLPELDSSILPAIIQFYYATIIIENAFFILPWEGIDKRYCLSTGKWIPPKGPPPTPHSNFTTTLMPPDSSPIGTGGPRQITAFPNITTTAMPETTGCLIDPTIISLAVPTLTIIGVIFRLVSSQKMVNYKNSLPSNPEKMQTQSKLEASVANLFSKKWTRMSVDEMFSAFLRMLKKEVIIPSEDDQIEANMIQVIGKNPKRMSFLAVRLQADFLASQTFIRESFSLIARRSTRSHDIGRLSEKFCEEEDLPPEYSSDSELTFRNNLKKRPRIPRSRNVSESVDVVESEAAMIVVELPSGTHYLETCWV